MSSGLKNKIFRVIAAILGTLVLGLSVFMAFIGNFDLWVGLFIGPMFLIYAFAGNDGLLESRFLSTYGKKIGK